ncbi:MAG: PAS domain-containing methyl-accepting chemotaxis protein [Porticoccaceae bacterium]
MKLNLPVTDREISLDTNARIISTTDLKGRINHGNEEFVRISGFTWEELEGSDHNIVRHPDMPPLAFEDLWTTLKSGKSWMGVVKNRTKNGDCYLVDAFVTLLYDQGNVIGYQSVRRMVEPEVRKRALALYAKLRKGQRLNRLTWTLGSRARYIATIFGVVLTLAAVAQLTGKLTWIESGIGLVLGGSLSAIAGWLLANPLCKAAAEARIQIDNPLMQAVYSGRNDEIGALILANRMLNANLQTVLVRVLEASEVISDAGRQTATAVTQTNRAVQQQQSQTDQVATAMNEMTATVQEVARNAGQAAGVAAAADDQAARGAEIVAGAGTRMHALVQEVERTAAVVGTLEADSVQIGSIVNMIREITDQTNLLALNAAIEAARAGEHGRGFAVVADEVRTLAGRTRKSTADIQEMVERLQSGSRDAVKVMEAGRTQAREAMDQVQQAVSAFGSITGAIREITDINAQIASAAQEQSAVAEEINRNINNISAMAAETSGASQGASQHTARVAETTLELVARLQSFRV